MNDKTENIKPELEIQTTDIAVSAMKSAVGTLPIVGSFLGELVGTIIPNQRFDRLVKYSQQLEQKMGTVDQSLIKLSLQNENFTDLMEDSLIQAARSLSDQRREYIASIIANSLTPNDIDFVESKQILKILGEINDIEIIWLRFYLCPLMGGDTNFREKHKEILFAKTHRYEGAPPNIKQKGIFKNRYIDHLVQLNLLKPDYEDIDLFGSKILVADGISRQLKITNYHITSLGQLLLRKIDLLYDYETNFPR